MNNSNKTTRELAIDALDWWNGLGLIDVMKLEDKYSINRNSLTRSQITTLYLSEHPETEDKEIDKLEQQLWDEPTGAPTSTPLVDVEEGIYKLDWDNDTGHNDESYHEWYNLINPLGETVAKIPDQREANIICNTLNSYSLVRKENKLLRESNERMKEALHKMYTCFGHEENYDNDSILILEEAKAALQGNKI